MSIYPSVVFEFIVKRRNCFAVLLWAEGSGHEIHKVGIESFQLLSDTTIDIILKHKLKNEEYVIFEGKFKNNELDSSCKMPLSVVYLADVIVEKRTGNLFKYRLTDEAKKKELKMISADQVRDLMPLKTENILKKIEDAIKPVAAAGGMSIYWPARDINNHKVYIPLPESTFNEVATALNDAGFKVIPFKPQEFQEYCFWIDWSK